MRIAVGLICIYSLIFCFGCKIKSKESNNVFQKEISTDNIIKGETQKANFYPNWVVEFRRLRTALFQQNMDSLCTFFDFPLSAEQEIGLIAAINFRQEKENLKPTELKTKSSFLKYAKNIFPTDFVKGMLPIKSDSLAKNNYATSNTWKIPNDKTEYSTTISFEEAEEKLSILFNATYFPEEIGEENEMEAYESALVFIFKIDTNGKLKFEQIIMAG